MIKIDMRLPENCDDCPMMVYAYDSDIFKEGEKYCCLTSESVEEIETDTRAEFCPLMEE